MLVNVRSVGGTFIRSTIPVYGSGRCRFPCFQIELEPISMDARMSMTGLKSERGCSKSQEDFIEPFRRLIERTVLKLEREAQSQVLCTMSMMEYLRQTLEILGRLESSVISPKAPMSSNLKCEFLRNGSYSRLHLLLTLFLPLFLELLPHFFLPLLLNLIVLVDLHRCPIPWLSLSHIKKPPNRRSQ